MSPPLGSAHTITRPDASLCLCEAPPRTTLLRSKRMIQRCWSYPRTVLKTQIPINRCKDAKQHHPLVRSTQASPVLKNTSITFRNVSFEYPGGHTLLVRLSPHRAAHWASFFFSTGKSTGIEGVSFSVRAGSFVGVCGGSGAGKTTLFRLIRQAEGRCRVGSLCSHAVSLTHRGPAVACTMSPAARSCSVACPSRR